jgi:hypothetical protein
MFDYTYPTPLPSTKGWGSGYPNCQPDKIVQHPVFVGGVHRRIKDLVDLLVAELKRKGFKFDAPGCWGYGCRGTKGGNGTTPSFHSWGLALDINAPENAMNFSDPQRAFDESAIAQHDQWIVKLLHSYGFFWLGHDGDPMHFSFCGSPADADAMLAKAKKNHLGEAPIVYRVGAKVFHRLSNAVGYVKRLLKKGKDATVRVIKR